MANKKFGSILRNLRNKAGYTQQQAADKLGLKNKSTLGSWEVGKSEPDGYTLLRLCKLYGVENIYTAFDNNIAIQTSSDKIILTNDDQKYMKKYRSLDAYGKRAVDSILDIEAERIMAAKHQEEKKKVIPANMVYLITYYSKLASAGTGEHIFDDMIKTQIPILGTELARSADFAIVVNGDTMEPDYKDSDIILVQRQDAINIGDIGIFILNNESLIRQAGDGRLIPRNPEYKDIIILDTDHFRCIGKIIGKARLV